MSVATHLLKARDTTYALFTSAALLASPTIQAQSGRQQLTREAQVVGNCMAASLETEATYMELMAGGAARVEARLAAAPGVTQDQVAAALAGLRADLDREKPKTAQDVIGIVGPKFEWCVVALGQKIDSGLGNSCYFYSNVIRLVYKHKGEGAAALAQSLSPDQGRLLLGTAERAAGTTAAPLEFEIQELLICLRLPERVYRE